MKSITIFILLIYSVLPRSYTAYESIEFEIVDGETIEKSNGWKKSIAEFVIENKNITLSENNQVEHYRILKSEVLNSEGIKILMILTERNGVEYVFKIFKEDVLLISISTNSNYSVYKVKN